MNRQLDASPPPWPPPSSPSRHSPSPPPGQRRQHAHPQGPTSVASSTTATIGAHGGDARPASPGRGVDAIYPVIGGVAGQLAVTAAAPGDNYHGGRWAVHVVTWNTAPYLLTSDEAVLAAAGGRTRHHHPDARG